MRLLKRGLSYLTITSYVGILLFGIFCHTFSFRTGSHPGMYYIVWDMFCGWSAYSIRTHIIGEGISAADRQAIQDSGSEVEVIAGDAYDIEAELIARIQAGRAFGG